MSKASTGVPHGGPGAGLTWIVVADAGRARLFECGESDGKVTELEDLLNPAARLQEHEAAADRKGRMTQGTAGTGQSFEPHGTRAGHEADRFAHTICSTLESARRSGRLTAIYLIAEPAFLGMIRKHLLPSTRSLIRQELASDLTRMPVAEIIKALPMKR